jgi:hypothetical protein
MIGADELQRVEDTKYLGVVIDNKLRFNKNIELIQKKNNQENQLYQTFGGGKLTNVARKLFTMPSSFHTSTTVHRFYSFPMKVNSTSFKNCRTE